jgi:hypothetical protein
MSAHRFRCSLGIAPPHGRDNGVVLGSALRYDAGRFGRNAPTVGGDITYKTLSPLASGATSG